MSFVGETMALMVPIVGAVALFTFLAVVGWAEERRKEREAYYRYEFRKRLVEAGKMDSEAVRGLMRFEYETELQRRRENLLIGGFIVAGVGVGLLLGLQFIEDEAVWMVGYIPAFIGAGMLVYALFFAPRPEPGRPPVGCRPEDGDEG